MARGLKTGGRKKGTPNRFPSRADIFNVKLPDGSPLLLSVGQILKDENYCPIRSMVECYRDARFVYENYAVIYEAIAKARDLKGMMPLDEKADKYLKIASDLSVKIADFTYPKPKDDKENDPLRGLTVIQIVEILRPYLGMLEAQVNGQNPSIAAPEG